MKMPRTRRVAGRGAATSRGGMQALQVAIWSMRHHSGLVLVDICGCDPHRFFGKDRIQIPHLLDLFGLIQRPEVFFIPRAEAQVVFAVLLKPAEQLIVERIAAFSINQWLLLFKCRDLAFRLRRI